MKKVISTILALVMVLAVCAAIPMTVSADGETLNTNRYFATNSTTGLDAYYGTPEIATWLKNAEDKSWGAINGDSDITTLKDSAWDNALKLTLNSSTGSWMKGGNVGSMDSDVWILWDNDNLYILQDVRKLYTIVSGDRDYPMSEVKTTSAALAQWGTQGSSSMKIEHSYYQILLPRDMTDLDDAEKRPRAYAVGSIPCINDTEYTEYDIYEAVARVRDFEYGATDSATNNKTMLPWAETYGEGIRTFVERLTTDGDKTTTFRTSTIIPWTAVDSTYGNEFANLTKEQKMGQTIGVWIFNNGGKHINNNGITVGSVTNNDTAGFDPVTLLAAATSQPKAGTTGTISADTQYWYDAFTADNPTEGGKTYYISNAAQLLGLSQIMENVKYTDINTKIGSTFESNDDKAYLTRGNTFKLTQDIDLNPGFYEWNAMAGVVHTYYNSAALDDTSFGIAKIGNVYPKNYFNGLDAFYGTFDGQGHTINGIFSYQTAGGSNQVTNDWGGLIGRIGQGGVKNLIIDNGYVREANDGGFGGVIGTIYATTYTTDANVRIDNLYVGENYIIDARNQTGSTQTGGIMCAEWRNGGPTAMNFYMSNVVFAGKILKGEKPVGLLLGRLNNSANGCAYTSYLTDCVGMGEYGLYAYGSISSLAKENEVRCAVVAKNAEIPAANAGNWVALTDGTVAPVKVADMLDTVRWQATVVESGRFNVRFVSEVDASNFANYDSVGHIVTITATKGTETKTSTVDFSDNTTVYKSVIANGVTIDANNAEKFGVIDGTHLVASVINLPDIDGVVYTASVKTVYKIGTTTIEGVAHDLGAIAPLN